MRLFKLFSLFLFLFVFQSNIIFGQNQIFVSTSGNDSTGDGSISNPYNTIKKAGDQANPGDTVFVRAGTYQNADFGDNDIWTDEPVARLFNINGSVDNFIIDNIAPTVSLTDTDSDNLVSNSDVVTITATFSESMTATPTLSLSGITSNAQMSATTSDTVWTYT